MFVLGAVPARLKAIAFQELTSPLLYQIGWRWCVETSHNSGPKRPEADKARCRPTVE
jgi:hypothetical protein